MSSQELEVIILKKQPLTEPDELITAISSKGKFRAVAKSTKRSSSKLAYGIQPLSLVNIRLSGKNELQQITGVNLVSSYPQIHSDPELIKIWYEVCELLLKGLPDWQESSSVMENLKLALDELNRVTTLHQAKLILAKFKLDFLDFVGFNISPNAEPKIWFDLTSGQFFDQPSPVVLSVAAGVSPLAFQIKQIAYTDLLKQGTIDEINELNKVITEFAVYHLERKLNAGNMVY